MALRFSVRAGAPFKGTIAVVHPLAAGEGGGEAEQAAWLQGAANRLVSLLRPRLAQWQADETA